VGELPTSVQAQLLTFLDERRFRRVGGTRVMQADVRILAATNVDLADRVASGRFRKDLFYRLSVVPIRMPPLRERLEEIPGLARSILADLGRRASRRVRTNLSSCVTSALQQYDWPGNLRELRSCGGNRTRAAELLGISRSTLKRNLAEMAQAGHRVPSGGKDDDGPGFSPTL
jgi:transcriptional regulator with PAS, ATPase and Fis domain